MEALGYRRFAMIGHDIGMWTGYAIASDHPERVERLALSEPIIPGVAPSPPLLRDRQLSDQLWHFNFNRVYEVNERLAEGREEVYFGHQFATKAATPTSIPGYAVELYVNTLKSSRDALRASFDYYRAIDEIIEQSQRRKQRKVTIPGSRSPAARPSAKVWRRKYASSPTKSRRCIPNCGHYVPEEAPEAMLEALNPLLAPYRDTFQR